MRTEPLTVEGHVRQKIRIKLEDAIAHNMLPDGIFELIKESIKKVTDPKAISEEEAREILQGARSIGTVPKNLRQNFRRYEWLRIDYSAWEVYLGMF